MKLITLNTWGGRVHEPIMDFFRRASSDTDIFCLQEVSHHATGKHHKYTENRPEFRSEIQEVLPEFEDWFHPNLWDYYGLAMFVRRTVSPKAVEETFVHQYKGFDPGEEVGYHSRNVQLARFDAPVPFTVVNFHGLWNGQGKGDSPERLEQSRKLVEALKALQGEVILCGDFNVNPDTESMAIIESAGLRNLVKEYGITSTRTSLYEKSGTFADYILVSPGIKVKDFRVLPDEVSDHAPLCLEFDV